MGKCFSTSCSKSFYEDGKTEHNVLLLHRKVRWFSREYMLNQVMKLTQEIAAFFVRRFWRWQILACTPSRWSFSNISVSWNCHFREHVSTELLTLKKKMFLWKKVTTVKSTLRVVQQFPPLDESWMGLIPQITQVTVSLVTFGLETRFFHYLEDKEFLA